MVWLFVRYEEGRQVAQGARGMGEGYKGREGAVCVVVFVVVFVVFFFFKQKTAYDV